MDAGRWALNAEGSITQLCAARKDALLVDDRMQSMDQECEYTVALGYRDRSAQTLDVRCNTQCVLQ